MKIKLTLALATAALAASTAFMLPAKAQLAGMKIGTLICSQSPGWGFIVGGSQPLNCRFTANNGVTRFYSGHVVSTLGMNIGYTEGGAINWVVFARSPDMRPGALSGTYDGVSARGANLMIGGFERAIELQPMNGNEATAGFGSIVLEYVGRT